MEKVKSTLKKYSSSSTETDYLLSTEANRKHLARSIDQANRGDTKIIKTEDLWKVEDEDASDKKNQKKIYNQIKQALRDVQLIEDGKMKAKSIDDFLKEL